MPTPTRRFILRGLPLLWCSAAAAEPLTLDALMARLAALPERRATFIETRRFAALDGTLESRGTLSYRGGTVEKVTTWPIPERLQIDRDRLVVTASNDPPRVIDTGMAPELRTLIDAIRAPLTGDAAALRLAFETRLTGTMEAWTLNMTPRAPSGRKVLAAVDLQGRNDQITTLTITQPNGDTQTMSITP